MVKDDPRSVGQRIRQARQGKNLSIQQLADKAGCSDEYLEWVEEGQVEPPVALLIQVAKAMQLDSGALLKFELDFPPGDALAQLRDGVGQIIAEIIDGRLAIRERFDRRRGLRKSGSGEEKLKNENRKL